LVGSAALLWFYGVACSLLLLRASPYDGQGALDWQRVLDQLGQGWLLLMGLAFAAAAIWCEGRLENAPEFPLGLIVGLLSVLLTVGLNALVLILAGETEWQVPALVLVLLHMPFAVVEGVILGFAVGFLMRVKPELLSAPDATTLLRPHRRRAAGLVPTGQSAGINSAARPSDVSDAS
jgi:hypothetical protein